MKSSIGLCRVGSTKSEIRPSILGPLLARRKVFSIAEAPALRDFYKSTDPYRKKPGLPHIKKKLGASGPM